jgi:cell division protein FtsA
MFSSNNIITAIEIGTSKIVVLVGSANEDGVTVIGRGEAESAGCVLKSEITEMQAAYELLNDALVQAEQSSGKRMADSDIFVLALSACGIGSFQGNGTVFIKHPDQCITDADVEEAIKNAQIIPLPRGQEQIVSFDSYFLIDGVRRVRMPRGQIGAKLEAFMHIVYGDANRIGNFSALLHDVGLGENITRISAGLADAIGVLTEEEKTDGVLLVNIGSGTTDYVVVYDMGVRASGSLTIGFDHVANDLALGLGLPTSRCREMLADGTISRYFTESAGVVEVKNANGSVTHIPISSFEKIIDLRLQELFELIKERVSPDNILRSLGCGGVLTGGGALFGRTAQNFRETFNFPVRIGVPLQGGGAMTDLGSPRYSTVWGALNYGNMVLQQEAAKAPGGIISNCSRNFGKFFDGIWNTFANLKRSMKV